MVMVLIFPDFSGLFPKFPPSIILPENLEDMPYDLTCECVGVQSLSARRSELGRRFFRSVTVSDSCLHSIFDIGAL